MGLTEPAARATIAAILGTFLLVGEVSAEGPAAGAAPNAAEAVRAPTPEAAEAPGADLATGSAATDATSASDPSRPDSAAPQTGTVDADAGSAESEEALRHAIESDVVAGGAGSRSAREAARIRRLQESLERGASASTHGGLDAATPAARLWRATGIALEAVSAYDAAWSAYGRAMKLGSRDCDVWRGLARMHRLDGELESAEEFWLRALERGCTGDAERELGELYLQTDQPAAAVVAFESAVAHGLRGERVDGLLARARFEADPAGAPEPARSWTAWPRAEELDWRAGAEAWLAPRWSALPPSVREPLEALAARVAERGGWILLAEILGGLMVLALAARGLRGRGDLVVSLEYPHELRGTFNVRLATARGRFKPRNRAERLALLEGGPSSRTEHHLVSRETHFRRIPPRHYHVTVEGLLQDPDTGEVLTEHFEERSMRVSRGRTARLGFDFSPRECPVDVKVLWDKKPVKEATVTARGRPNALRFARGGSTRIGLPKGRHVLAIGSGDRVIECEVDVAGFKPVTVEVDVGVSERLVFKGCPPAVEPYLQGDLGTAARALERDGQAREANLLLGRLERENGRFERAAEHLEAAGQWLDAARLRAEVGDPARAADLFARAGDPLRAAELFAEAGDALRAGEAFEQAGDTESAIRCYREAGETTRWADALERRGQVFEAAQVCLSSGDRARALRLLQLVPPDHPKIVTAAEQLADALEQEGHVDLAAQRLDEIASAWGQGDGTPELRARLADLHEKSGHFERALEVWEELRSLEPTWPSVATRIESLRKRLSARASGGRLSGSDLATTGFLGEQRYELLEEIGRGGMGVVYRARDKRLDRVVALKRLPENLRDHPKAIQLFLREAQASARLTHRNITTVYDADQENGVFFITMELLQGQPLNRILRKKGRLVAKTVAQLGMQIADGLQYAHSQRIVHRDIKTANLFFTVDRTVKIMDFGLAKMMEEVRRAATVIGGTPYYMAPEQAEGRSVDHRADLYAFGVTMFELATGSLPFTEGDVTYHHRHTPAPDLRERAPEAPAALAELVLDLMRKSPEDRPESAAAVRRRLESLATG